MAPLSIELSGAPDELIGTPEGKGSAVQVMQIDLTQAVLDELLQCTRSGKPPQILFGRNPRLEYGDKSRILEHSSENFRHELYRYEGEEKEQEWAFSGLINHSLQLQRLQEVSAGSDMALENLKNSLATIQEQRDADRTIISSMETAAPSRNNKFLKSKGHLRTPSHLANLQRSSPNSPSLSAINSPALGAAPTSIPETEDMAMLLALRKSVLHLLAVKPLPLDVICQKTRAKKYQVQRILEQTAKRNTSDTGAEVFQLTDKSYKLLDVYRFGYDKEERQSAVNNAVRAFDRMRLGRDDKLWQMLLPEEERGKGKVLSRLGNLSQGTQNNTPMMTGQKIDRKTGLLKKTAVKKEKKTTKQDDDGDKEQKGEAAVVKSAPQEKEKKPKDPSTMATKGSDTPRMGRKDLNKPKASKPSSNSQRPAPPASKPKNPSPLSSSPPVNASDFEDNHPVHKHLQASASPAKKRKADDADSHTSTPPTKARKLHPSAAAKTGTPNGLTPTSNGHSHSHHNTPNSKPANGVTHTSSSSQSPSPPLTLSWRQQLELAQRFKKYYANYEKLWHQLAEAPEAPSKGQREELMRMHDRLGEMKREIAGGRVR